MEALGIKSFAPTPSTSLYAHFTVNLHLANRDIPLFGSFCCRHKTFPFIPLVSLMHIKTLLYYRIVQTNLQYVWTKSLMNFHQTSVYSCREMSFQMQRRQQEISKLSPFSYLHSSLCSWKQIFHRTITAPAPLFLSQDLIRYERTEFVL